MDYHDSSAGNARLAVIKYPATAERLGTIFYNPGDPLRPSLVVFHSNILQADLAAQDSKSLQESVKRIIKVSRVRMT